MKLTFREPVNGLTHFIGILLAVACTVLLLMRTTPAVSFLHAVTFSVFGVGMFLLYTFSTLYHWLPLSGKKLELFRKIDHIMIFVFIAASYTPVCLITLRGVWGWSILTGVWVVAVAGFFLKIFWLNAPRFLYTFIYVLMGWTIIIAIWPLTKVLPGAGFFWLGLEGVFYTVGAVIYALKKPDPFPKVFGFHEIFHVFIILGSLAQFWLLYRYI